MGDTDDIEEEDEILKPGEILDDQYRIESELGRGGIGAVYKADDLENHIPVAIKVLLEKWAKDRKMKARFLREPRLAIRARHPNIVQVHAIKQRKTNGVPYIVMEFIEGQVLLDRLKAARNQGTKLGLSFLPLAGQLASVLAACHARNIVHRDLKPANIMSVPDEDVVGGERVKLLDFGIAKIFTDEDEGTQTSLGDQQPGTPAYMAPEQFGTLDKDADPAKMDVYAFGVILYQALAGRLPLWSSNRMGLMAMVAGVEPEPLLKLDPSLPVDLAQLVHEMLAKDPRQRPTMDQVRERLKSRREVVTIRPTVEINALVPAPQSEGSGAAPTADEPVQALAQSTVPPALPLPVKSIGERSTQPQPPEAFDGGISSVGRGTGQQLTEERTRKRRRTNKLGVGVAGAILVVLAVAGVAWRKVMQPLPPKPAAVAPSPPPTSTAQSGPQPKVAPPPPLAPTEPATPARPAAIEKEAAAAPEVRRGKSKPVCVEPTEACISGKATTAQQTLIVSSLREAKIRLCPADSLRVSPDYDITATGIRKNKQEDFQNLLRGHLRSSKLQGQVEIRCPAK